MAQPHSLADPAAPSPPQGQGRHRRWWAAAAVVVAVVAIVAAAVVGVRGLLASPIRAIRADGTAVIGGTWEPCTSCATPGGYVQAGARSVFVVLPSDCTPPPANHDVTVVARRDPTLGSGSYRALDCPHPG